MTWTWALGTLLLFLNLLQLRYHFPWNHTFKTRMRFYGLVWLLATTLMAYAPLRNLLT